jgi:hypothetical protein
LLNRNPLKRLGSGPRDAEEIKEHKFFEAVNWQDALQRKLKVPLPHSKQLVKQEVPLDKIYGRGAFDEALKHKNRVNEWSYI